MVRPIKKPFVKYTQANFSVPEDLMKDFRNIVPHGEQSRIVTEALGRELKRIKFQKALDKCFGAWGPREDLGSTKSFIRSLRRDRKI